MSWQAQKNKKQQQPWAEWMLFRLAILWAVIQLTLSMHILKTRDQLVTMGIDEVNGLPLTTVASGNSIHSRLYTLRKLPVKFSLVIYFPCQIVLIYQECGDSACRSHNEITRQRGQINTIGVGLLRTRNSGKFYTVCVIILHRVFCV